MAFLLRGLNRLKEATGALFGDIRLPKSFRDNLTKHGGKRLQNIQVVREPLQKAVNAFANALTLGKFGQVAQQQGEAGFFHLYSILHLDDGTRLIYEKNERPRLEVFSGELPAKAEHVSASGRGIVLNDFVQRSMKAMGDQRYITYDPIRNNCQDFLIGSFQANGLLTPELATFIKQNVQQLIEETPSFSQSLAKGLTDFAGKGREIFEELWKKRGGYRSLRIGGAPRSAARGRRF